MEPSPRPTDPAEIVQLVTTVGSEADAGRIADHLIEKKLAACVQIDATIQSVYAWKGETCRDPEWRVVIKTTGACWDAIQQAMAEVHPYELPELIGQTMTWVSPGYRQWIADQVRP